VQADHSIELKLISRSEMATISPFPVGWLAIGCRILARNEFPAMPKQKTHKGTKKRFRLTAKGKVKHRPAGTSHLATRKDQKRIRKLRGTDTLAPGMVKAVKKALAGNSY
jgi:large subunit ribosomal protein L35